MEMSRLASRDPQRKALLSRKLSPFGLFGNAHTGAKGRPMSCRSICTNNRCVQDDSKEGNQCLAPTVPFFGKEDHCNSDSDCPCTCKVPGSCSATCKPGFLGVGYCGIEFDNCNEKFHATYTGDYRVCSNAKDCNGKPEDCTCQV